MNESEARSTLAKYVNKYRSRSYEYLAAFARLGRTDTANISSASGGKYEVEVQVSWDGKQYGSVRVVARITGGSARPAHIEETFVMRPDGEFTRSQGVKGK